MFIETKNLIKWTYEDDVDKGLERLEKVFDAEKNRTCTLPSTISLY